MGDVGRHDEYAIAGLVTRGATIDAYGVGTTMGMATDAPVFDSACIRGDRQGAPATRPGPQ